MVSDLVEVEEMCESRGGPETDRWTLGVDRGGGRLHWRIEADSDPDPESDPVPDPESDPESDPDSKCFECAVCAVVIDLLY